jgi:alanine racemase
MQPTHVQHLSAMYRVVSAGRAMSDALHAPDCFCWLLLDSVMARLGVAADDVSTQSSAAFARMQCWTVMFSVWLDFSGC